MPGVRGAMARAEDHGYQPAPGRFLASAHIAQEMAWLQAEVAWAVADGAPGLGVEGGTLRDGEVPVVTVRVTASSVEHLAAHPGRWTRRCAATRWPMCCA